MPRPELRREITTKIIRHFKNSPCLWDPQNMYYYKKPIRRNALLRILKVWQKYDPTATLELLKKKIDHLRSAYRKERRKVESKIGTESEVYKPTLWYYEHLNFLSGENDEEDELESEIEDDDNNGPMYVQVPPEQSQASEVKDPEPQPDTSVASVVEASATAFGQSVGAQLQHLSKVQRCIAEKLISDIIYHGKMEQLTMNSCVNLNLDINTPHDQPIHESNIIIPKSEPSWYDMGHSDSSQQESSSSGTFLANADMGNQRDQETESAVSCIKCEAEESHNMTFHITQDDLNEQSSTSIIKTE